ncbi:MAG: 16S rRNA (adenine(1518)-N(6)/adenine(1519)-N(6))-dimethyltransferase RsmA [Chloroflexota bacterium]|nr:16S rRNA (adenine(1518)-N(6)/adenine(1519)-N(6))-dimethyltransferase RsmA [Chloroflexota bacterium]
MRRLNIRARKGLGQHFLIDEHALSEMIAAAELAPGDAVIEVGPGLGVLTRELAQKAGRVVAVELDDAMAVALDEKFAGDPDVEIVNADILQCDPASLVPGGSPYKMIGALPYNIASAVLRRFLESHHKPLLMVVVLQREVAQSVAAAPGDMGLVSVGVQFYGRPSIIGYVSPQGFYPSPKVDSAIVRIDVYPSPPIEVEDEAVFFDVVRGGFAAPRKQLRNSLAMGLSITSKEADGLLDSAGVDPRRRAETLSLQEWRAVYRAFIRKR